MKLTTQNKKAQYIALAVIVGIVWIYSHKPERVPEPVVQTALSAMDKRAEDCQALVGVAMSREGINVDSIRAGSERKHGNGYEVKIRVRAEGSHRPIMTRCQVDESGNITGFTKPIVE